jgi:lipid-binding SYLF domain-containing protein
MWWCRQATITGIMLAILVGFAPEPYAASAVEIDARVDAALAKFGREVGGGDAFLATAKGVLVFPKVFKAGVVVGGEYGEGALRIDGVTVDYYSTRAASLGLQLGAQQKTIILVFMQKKALDRFRAGIDFKVGVDGSVAIMNVGAGGTFNTDTARAPIVGFIFGQKGFMANLTLEGTSISKIKPQ